MVGAGGAWLGRRGHNWYRWDANGRVKKVNGQEPPSGESPTTECGFNYQLLSVIY